MKKFLYITTALVIMVTVVMLLGILTHGADEPVITVDNYIVTITEANQIKDMRYVLGSYSTVAEVRSAPGNVVLSNKVVVAHTADGVFTYEMPDGGYYTFWIRMQDGTNYIKSADMTNIVPTLSSYGVTITIHNLYNVKDFFIAKGEYQTYSEIKTAGYIFSAGAAKIAGKHDYKYTVKEPGMHTVLIRYIDGTAKALHEELTVDEPEFAENGLQVTISNIPDVKIIRTAYGEWSTTKELKQTDTLRNFSAKTAIKGKDPYTIQYRNEGMVTIIVEYNNGYVKVHHYDVQKKVPTVENTDTGVKFGNLDGLVLIRYAKGEYTTAADIKYAEGCVVLKPKNIVDGYINVAGLTPGMTYSFYAQYDDDSYTFYTITMEGEITEMSGEFIMHTPENNPVNALQYWLYTPSDTTEAKPLIVLLHSAHTKMDSALRTPEENLNYMVGVGYDINNDFTEYVYKGEFGDIPAYILMPQTDNNSNGWPQRGQEIVDLINYYKNSEDYNIKNERVSLWGYSIGGTGAVELANMYPEVFDRVVSVAGGLDGLTNKIRPYIPNVGRKDIDDEYPELVIGIKGTDSYEKSHMKYLYAKPDSVYYADPTTAAGTAATAFRARRIDDIADNLTNNSIKLWAIIGTTDEQVNHSVLYDLCTVMNEKGGVAERDALENHNHSNVFKYALTIKQDIINFLLEGK